MMLGQTGNETTTGTWAAAGAVVVLILTNMSKIFGDWRKDKRDAEIDQQKANHLESIAKTNSMMLTTLGEIKGGQAAICKASCNNFSSTPTNKQEKENK